MCKKSAENLKIFEKIFETKKAQVGSSVVALLALS
jgi:hypothetical protein